jgi:putative membrane protein
MTSLKFTLASLAAAAMAAASLSGWAQSDKDGQKSARVSKSDMRSMQKMAQADMAEIETGKLAAQKAENPEVKKFGQHMVDEHSKMLSEGSQIAKAKGATPPSGPDGKHQKALQKLQGLSGAEFDRAYLKQMVEDHEDALKLVQKAAKNAKDPELKAHAKQGEPHIKEHLAMARKLEKSFSAGAGGTKK